MREALQRAEVALEKSYAKQELLRMALTLLLKRYLDVANSGDGGNWDPEEEMEVIAARKALTDRF